ncbi:MAG: HPr family phosphocarrier protein [Clostridiales bacterium]|nr:HPr family phosphocarrier protein [Clostridiales bacterium]
MTSFSILLSSVADVKDFVDTISRFRCEVDVLAGRYVVNAKSIMGLFSIDLSQPVTVAVHDDAEAAALKAAVSSYLAD